MIWLLKDQSLESLFFVLPKHFTWPFEHSATSQVYNLHTEYIKSSGAFSTVYANTAPNHLGRDGSIWS